MISQLIQKIQKTKAPICVGLDPMLGYIPNHIVQRAFKDFGETMEGAAEAVWQFNKEIIDNTYDLIPSVKPQIAMYEQFGIEGLKIYARTIEYCQNKGLLVIRRCKERRYRIHFLRVCSWTYRKRKSRKQRMPRLQYRLHYRKSVPRNRRHQTVRQCLQR